MINICSVLTYHSSFLVSGHVNLTMFVHGTSASSKPALALWDNVIVKMVKWLNAIWDHTVLPAIRHR